MLDRTLRNHLVFIVLIPSPDPQFFISQSNRPGSAAFSNRTVLVLVEAFVEDFCGGCGVGKSDVDAPWLTGYS